MPKAPTPKEAAQQALARGAKFLELDLSNVPAAEHSAWARALRAKRTFLCWLLHSALGHSPTALAAALNQPHPNDVAGWLAAYDEPDFALCRTLATYTYLFCLDQEGAPVIPGHVHLRAGAIREFLRYNRQGSPTHVAAQHLLEASK